VSALYEVATALLFSGAFALALNTIVKDGAAYWDRAVSAFLYGPRQ
jgi:hypothetical protein